MSQETQRLCTYLESLAHKLVKTCSLLLNCPLLSILLHQVGELKVWDSAYQVAHYSKSLKAHIPILHNPHWMWECYNQAYWTKNCHLLQFSGKTLQIIWLAGQFRPFALKRKHQGGTCGHFKCSSQGLGPAGPKTQNEQPWVLLWAFQLSHFQKG